MVGTFERTRGCIMSEAWKHWEGQVVDSKFLLRRYLGGSEHSAVFLTERGFRAPSEASQQEQARAEATLKAAIKFIQVDEPNAELQLSRWKRAEQFSQPHLLRVFDSGRCRLGDFDLLYVVTEYAEENLSQFLPQRPLTPAEARDVLLPVLEALTFLHGEGLVHGHVQPSNIFAIEDQLKLSSDGLSEATAPASKPSVETSETSKDQPVDEAKVAAPASLRQPTPYDPPEAANGILSPAGDIWSLGVTLVEALTQRLPVMPIASSSTRPAGPIVPETLPALFLEIVRHCLDPDPARRWTVREISARLNPAAPVAASPAATPRVRPAVSIPSPAVRVPTPSTQPAEPYRVTPVAKAPLQAQSAMQRDPHIKPRYDLLQPRLKQPPLLPKLNYLGIVSIAAMVIIVTMLTARLFSHRASARQTVSVEATQPPAAKPVPPVVKGKNSSKGTQKSVAAQSSQPAQSPVSRAVTSAQNPSKPTTGNKPSAGGLSPANAGLSANSGAKDNSIASSAPATTTAALRAETPPSEPLATNVAERSAAGVAQGEVLEQVLPEPSPKAQATIRGKVRVRVKLRVDSSGNVVAADFDSPGPSKYFADLALQAARRWDFAPAKLDGHNVPSDWLVRFEFSQTATKAFPTQATP